MPLDPRIPGGDGSALTDRPAILYTGKRQGSGTLVLRVDDRGEGQPLPWRLDLFNHSPTGLEWGYGGSGPSQLALAILADAYGAELALSIYQDFKRAVIATIDKPAWTITRVSIDAWRAAREVSP